MTTGERLSTYWAERQGERAQLATLAARYWQVGLIVALIAVAAALRLWDLSGRAVHHDESIHVKFAWDITQGASYIHDPVYHGPFQYFGTAATFLLFGGSSDFTARLLPALFGIGLVGLPFLLRRQLGTLGAFVAAGFLAFSPVLLYFSRFARNDIYVAVFTLAIVIAMWRFLSDRKYGWLIAIGPLLALSFAAKEVTFITVAVLLVYLNFMVANELIDQIRASRRLRPEQTLLAYALIMPTAWAIVALWPLLRGWRERFALSEMPAAGPLLIIVGTLAAPQYAAGIQKVPFIGDDGYQVASEQNLMHVTILTLILGSAAVGLLWRPRVWLMAAGLFYIVYVLLFTSFFTNMAGFWSGNWGSLDYWLGQQLVRRGGQPDYYYFILLPAYEFLPLAFALGGALYYGFRGKLEQKLLTASALLLVTVLAVLPDSFPLLGGIRIEAAFIIAIGTVLALSMEGFTKFLIFWTLSILLSITIAGEKMPWLTVHLALPLALLGAKILDDVLSRVDLRMTVTAARRRRDRAPTDAAWEEEEEKEEEEEEAPSLAWERLAPFGAGALLALLAALAFLIAGPSSPLSVVAWLLSLAALGAVLWAARSVSWQAAGQVAAVALFAALAVFTLRTGGTAAFDEGDPGGTPPELLIYAQGSPQLSAIRDDIDRLASDSGVGHNLRIVVDNSANIWPWPWYLRDYNNVQYINIDDSFEPEAGSVLLLTTGNQSRVEPFLDQFQEGIPYTHMWWFPERYRNLEAASFLGDTITGNNLDTFRTYFIDRTVTGVTTGPDRIAYFPSEFPTNVTASEGPLPDSPPPPPTGPAQLLDEQLQVVVGSSGDGDGEFSQPAGLTVDADGNLYIVDTLNHRVQKLAQDGSFIDAIGGQGSDPGEYANPQAQDSQFAPDGPWGVAVDADGNLYVADTWNHRIQKYGPDLNLVADWSIGGLFGPRDIAITSAGNLLVVDTGNKRIMEYTPAGEFLQQHGSAGDGPGEFNEPSSISITSDGDIYIADYWNRRIQHFDAEFNYIDEIAVPTWGSSGITDRAYLVALDNGTILATDPASSRILIFDASGTETAAWRLIEGESRPIGIVVNEGQIYVSDGAASEVRRIPLIALLAASAP